MQNESGCRSKEGRDPSSRPMDSYGVCRTSVFGNTLSAGRAPPEPTRPSEPKTEAVPLWSGNTPLLTFLIVSRHVFAQGAALNCHFRTSRNSRPDRDSRIPAQTHPYNRKSTARYRWEIHYLVGSQISDAPSRYLERGGETPFFRANTAPSRRLHTYT